MTLLSIIQLPFSHLKRWKHIQQRHPSIATLAWCVVLPMSLLPPVLLYYAATHYGDSFAPGFADRQWRFITTILFLAELLTFFLMGWLIHAVVNSNRELSMSYHDAYLVAALAPLHYGLLRSLCWYPACSSMPWLLWWHWVPLVAWSITAFRLYVSAQRMT